MNYSEITFSTLIRALRRQWKIFGGCIVAFTAIGAITGLILADDLAASPKGATVDGLILPDCDAVTYNVNYYSACSNHLSEAYIRASNCLQVLDTEPVSATERETLEIIQAEMAKLYESALVPLFEKISTGTYIPEGCMEDAIRACEARLFNAQANLRMAQESVAFLEAQGIPVPDAGEKIPKEHQPYAIWINSANQKDIYEQAETAYQQRLNLLQEDPDAIVAQSQALETELHDAQQSLHQLIAALQDTVIKIAKSNHLEIFVFYDQAEDGYFINGENLLLENELEGEKNTKDSESIIILHNYGYRSEQDAFLILTLFCLLVGVCAGGFFAVCREAGEKKKHCR